MAKVKQKYLTYAGIGARSTPPEVLSLMTEMATELEELGFILRTGGATGADSAFLDGITKPEIVELYLPWAGYNGYESPFHKVSKQAIHLASQFHPNWNACKDSVRKLHGRNCNILLGPNVMQPMPAEFVICWTPNGSATGGTGMAITLADAYLIPVFDLGAGIDSTLYHLQEYIESNY